MSLAKRRGMIFIDYLRNARGATSVLPYSARAKEGTAFSVPVSWEELAKPASSYSLDVMKKRLKSVRTGPWKRVFSLKQSLAGLKKMVRP